MNKQELRRLIRIQTERLETTEALRDSTEFLASPSGARQLEQKRQHLMKVFRDFQWLRTRVENAPERLTELEGKIEAQKLELERLKEMLEAQTQTRTRTQSSAPSRADLIEELKQMFRSGQVSDTELLDYVSLSLTELRSTIKNIREAPAEPVAS